MKVEAKQKGPKKALISVAVLETQHALHYSLDVHAMIGLVLLVTIGLLVMGMVRHRCVRQR